jgi:hypothetical protein
MKKIIVMLTVALLVCVSFGQAKGFATLASARSKITRVIENPKEMTAVMQTLSPADQKTFLAEVVAAVASMPSDESDRTAKFVEIVNAGLAGSQKGNSLTLVAEVYATVPPNALAAVNESLASGLMNRATDGNVTYTDEQYIEISKKVMAAVNERVANEDNAGVRSGFAALMMIRGSNSESPEIVSSVVESLPEAVQNDAKNEWIPAALGQGGQEKTYDPMLAVVDGDQGRPVNEDAVGTAAPQQQQAAQETSSTLLSLRVASAQNLDTLLADIVGANTDPSASANDANPVVDAVQNTTNSELPLGNGEPGGDAGETGSIIEEVIGYQNQTTKD